YAITWLRSSPVSPTPPSIVSPNLPLPPGPQNKISPLHNLAASVNHAVALTHTNLRQASRWLQAFGMSNLRYTYCFRTRQNQDAARPTRFPDHGASRKGQSRAACSLVSLPTFRRYQGTAEDHGQDCGAIQKVRRHDSGPGEKDRFLSLIFATVLLPLLRIFWISGLQQTLCL